MRRIKYFFFCFLVGMAIVSCRRIQVNSDSGIDKYKQGILQDSLTKLDSLILKYRVINPSVCYKYAKEANEIAKKINTHEAFARANMMFGNVYFSSKMDSSFYYDQQALLIIDSFQIKKEKGNVLYNLGMLYNVQNPVILTT